MAFLGTADNITGFTARGWSTNVDLPKDSATKMNRVRLDSSLAGLWVG